MAGRIKATLLRGVSSVADAYTKHLNRGITRKNEELARDKKATHAPIEKRKIQSVGGIFKVGVVYNPNRPGRCAAYATRIAANNFGKKYVRANAWELPQKNRVTFETKLEKGGISADGLRVLIGRKAITPGTIIGVYNRASPSNRPDRAFTHVLVYVGEETFWHNWGGPRKITIDKLFSIKVHRGERQFVPLVVIEPKE
jgi:hypothetical protein